MKPNAIFWDQNLICNYSNRKIIYVTSTLPVSKTKVYATENSETPS